MSDTEYQVRLDAFEGPLAVQTKRAAQENGQNREGKEDGERQMILGNTCRVKDVTGVESAESDRQNEQQPQGDRPPRDSEIRSARGLRGFRDRIVLRERHRPGGSGQSARGSARLIYPSSYQSLTRGSRSLQKASERSSSPPR